MSVRYQLRRIDSGVNVKAGPAPAVINLEQEQLWFGRNPEQVQVVLHSALYANMISRQHAVIQRQRNADGSTAFYLLDHSLNGTYVNRQRVNGAHLLHPGDIIDFGHLNGAAIAPGQTVISAGEGAEFSYRFEKASRLSQGAPAEVLGCSEAALAGCQPVLWNAAPDSVLPQAHYPAAASQTAQVLMRHHMAAASAAASALANSYSAVFAYPTATAASAPVNYFSLWQHQQPAAGHVGIAQSPSLVPLPSRPVPVMGLSAAMAADRPSAFVQQPVLNAAVCLPQKSPVAAGSLPAQLGRLTRAECDSSVPSPPTISVALSSDLPPAVSTCTPSSAAALDSELAFLAQQVISKSCASPIVDDFAKAPASPPDKPASETPTQRFTSMYGPAVAEAVKKEDASSAEPQAKRMRKRKRKTNELGRLLDDLSEWPQLGRRSVGSDSDVAPSEAHTAASSDESEQAKSSGSRGYRSPWPARKKRKQKELAGKPSEQLYLEQLVASSGGLLVDRDSFHIVDEPCAAAKWCRKPADDKVDWVQCDRCQGWYHLCCSGCALLPDDFTCKRCQRRTSD